MKIYWAARHELLPEQEAAIRATHGEDCNIIWEPVRFTDPRGLSDYIDSRPDDVVYAVAGGIHYLFAGFEGKEFYLFESDRDSTGFKALFKVSAGTIIKIREVNNKQKFIVLERKQ